MILIYESQNTHIWVFSKIIICLQSYTCNHIRAIICLQSYTCNHIFKVIYYYYQWMHVTCKVYIINEYIVFYQLWTKPQPFINNTSCYCMVTNINIIRGLRVRLCRRTFWLCLSLSPLSLRTAKKQPKRNETMYVFQSAKNTVKTVPTKVSRNNQSKRATTTCLPPENAVKCSELMCFSLRKK